MATIHDLFGASNLQHDCQAMRRHPTEEEFLSMDPNFFTDCKENFERKTGIGFQEIIHLATMLREEIGGDLYREVKKTFQVTLIDKWKIIMSSEAAPSFTKEEIMKTVKSALANLNMWIAYHNDTHSKEEQIELLDIDHGMVKEKAAQSLLEKLIDREREAMKEDPSRAHQQVLAVFIDDDFNVFYGSPKIRRQPHYCPMNESWLTFFPPVEFTRECSFRGFNYQQTDNKEPTLEMVANFHVGYY